MNLNDFEKKQKQGEYKEPKKASDDIKSDDDLKAEIEKLKIEILEKVLEHFKKQLFF